MNKIQELEIYLENYEFPNNYKDQLYGIRSLMIL